MFTDGFEKTANFTHTLKQINSFVNPFKYRARRRMGEGLLKRTQALTLGDATTPGRGSNRLGLKKNDMIAASPAEVGRAKTLASEGKLDQSSVAAISKNQEEAAKKVKEQVREKVIARHKRFVGSTTPWAYRHPYLTGAGLIAGTKFISNNSGPKQEDPTTYPQYPQQG